MAVRRRAAMAVGVTLLLTACTSSARQAAPAPRTSPTSTSLPATTTRSSTTSTRPAPTTTTTTLLAGLAQRPIAVPGASILLRFDEGVPPEALSVVEETIPVAYDALGESGPLVVHVYASADTYVASHDPRSQERARADIDGGVVATGGAGAIRIYSPRFLDRDTTTRRLIVIHEYFHTVQSRLSAGRGGVIPLWLREGTARYVEYGVAGDHGYIDYGRRRTAEVRTSRGLESLQTYEEQGGPTFRGDSGGAYVVGFLASEYLETLKGRQAVQRDFWAALRTSADWRAAFTTVFGISVDQFYADFESYRKTL
ncbi:MAG TPA: hypothetical protein VMZ73_00870 [Acidimicrobiales bacterium]|nr:hypothetical protein [Acidimicrobiales bacterium]